MEFNGKFYVVLIDLSQIHPVSDFARNYKSYLGRIQGTGNPEVLTVNGKPAYVILDVESYQALANELERRRFVKAVNEGIEDMNGGRREPIEEAFAGIRKRLDL